MNEDLRYIEQFIEDKRHSSHPSDALLARLIDNKLTDKEKEEVILHLIECYECREIVSNVTQDRSSSSYVAQNIKEWSPLLVMVASVILFITFPNKEEITLGIIDLSQKSTTEYKNAENTKYINKIIDADKIIKEIIASNSFKDIEYFHQAIEAEEENRWEEAQNLYKQAFKKIIRNPDATKRLEQKITIHYKLLKISHKQENKDAVQEYKNIILDEIRTYLLLYKKGKQ